MIFEESRMKFKFAEGSKTVKFDDEEFYRKYFNKLPDSKAVDFIFLTKEYMAFVEVKNCLGDEGNCRWRIFPNNKKKETSHTIVDVEGRDSLDIEVPQKIAMTLAALSGVISFGETRSSTCELSELAYGVVAECLKDTDKKKYVILFLEGNFESHTRSKKMIMSALQKEIKKKLEWLNIKVSVVDSDTYKSDIFQIVS